jgi:hypothetical protein
LRKIPQNILILCGCIVVAIVILATFVGFSSQKQVTHRQAIHIDVNANLDLPSMHGPMKISDMKPNSMAWFFYPDPDRYKDRDPYGIFLLIRLPDYLGGTNNDASAFRAYSALDPSSHCLVKYWPQENRRRIEDSCSGSIYNPVSGHMMIQGGNPVLVTRQYALPYLKLETDENGYLYAEPPRWTEDKNGVVGIGRQITAEEMKAAEEFVAQREGLIKQKLASLNIPKAFSSGHKLAFVDDYGLLTKRHAEYAISGSDVFRIMLDYEFCNCTKTAEKLGQEKIVNRSRSQLIQLEGIPILAYPNKIDYVNNIHDRYVFVFYYEGYKITFRTNQLLEAGTDLLGELIESIQNTGS